MNDTKKKRSSGNRDLTVKVKTAKGRKLSSTRWLQRQLNDPFVAAAKRDGYRSRAAYKLIEIDDKFNFLKSGATVIDLGCAPGSWTQIAAQRCQSEQKKGSVIGLDLLEISPIPGATCLVGDFLEEETFQELLGNIGEQKANVVLSDMAPAAMGHKQTDHLRIMGLCEAAFEFACDILAHDGAFLAKVLQGGTENALLAEMKRRFASVRHIKPKASRADSSELYVLALGYHG
ncbi:MAG: RlmE family RNA methyltransferase [Pseudomonadota bacterium]